MNSPVDVPEIICEFPEALKPLRERILANLVMISQMPAPTGHETGRVRFLLDRFAEAGLSDATRRRGRQRRRAFGRKRLRANDPARLAPRHDYSRIAGARRGG